MVTPERMTIAIHSEALYLDELSVLSTPSTIDHTTDVLVQFKNSDSCIYLTLVMTSLLLVILVSISMKIKFESSLWLVLKVVLHRRNINLPMEILNYTFLNSYLFAITSKQSFIDINNIFGVSNVLLDCHEQLHWCSYC